MTPARLGWLAGWAAVAAAYLLIASAAASRLAYLLTSPQQGWPPRGPIHIPINDFGLFWFAGQLARQRDFVRLYDAHAFSAYLSQATGHAGIVAAWVYPPPAVPLAATLSLLPPDAAYLAWQLGVPLGCVWLLRRAGLGAATIAAGLLGPAGLLTLTIGQRGMLIGGLATAALLGGLTADRPRAGAWLGLALIKPHTVLFAPIALLRRGRLAVLAAAALSGASLLLLAFAWFGPALFAAYLQGIGDDSGGILTDPATAGQARDAVTVFWMLRGLGLGLSLAMAGQALAALLALAALIRWSRRPDRDPTRFAALALILSLLAPPYAFAHDCVGYELAIAFTAARRPDGPSPLDGAFWLAPGLSHLLAVWLGFTPMPLIVAAAALRVAR